MQASAAGSASNAPGEDGTQAGHPLGVSAQDLLSDRGQDLLAGHADPAASQTTLNVASVTHELPLVPIDHTKLIDDKPNNVLI